MSRTLFFDVETTALFDERLKADDPRQARIVQLGAILLDMGGREVSSIDLLVDPGVDVPESSTAVHGIANDVAQSCGVSERAAVGLLARLAGQCDVIVAHNLKFDLNVAMVAAERSRFKFPVPKIGRCTMEAATPILALPPTTRMIQAGIDKPKPPKLTEAAALLLGIDSFPAHRAIEDVRVTVRLYHRLVELGCWKEAA
jgi:DNA polymerase-3 subunit epsilon